MLIAIIFMLIFAGTSLYLAKRLYNVTAETADMRGFYDGLARRYEPLIQGRTAPAEEPAPEPVPVAVDVVGAPDADPDGFDALVKILESAGYDIAFKARPNGSPAPADDPVEEKPADYPAEEKQTDDNAPEPARDTPKSKKTPRKPAAGRKGRKQ